MPNAQPTHTGAAALDLIVMFDGGTGNPDDDDYRDPEGLTICCPHPDCTSSQIYEVDRAIRWNECEIVEEHDLIAADDLDLDAHGLDLHVRQGDGDFHTVRWMCQVCQGPINLPDYAETHWS